jgi:predicted enzyme related to lactoylglutathione lyase
VDRDELIRFYETAFDASFQAETGSFVFGHWPSDDFFLLTLADRETHPGAAGPARFGLVVDDLDGSHGRALDAGAAEVYPPIERPWKPRSSCLIDPAGNHIDLYQA